MDESGTVSFDDLTPEQQRAAEKLLEESRYNPNAYARELALAKYHQLFANPQIEPEMPDTRTRYVTPEKRAEILRNALETPENDPDTESA